MQRYLVVTFGLAFALTSTMTQTALADGDLKEVHRVTNTDAINFAVEAKTYGTNRLFVTSRGQNPDPRPTHNADDELGGVSVWNLSNPAAPTVLQTWRPSGAATYDDARFEGQDRIGNTLVVIAQTAQNTGILYTLQVASNGTLSDARQAAILDANAPGSRYSGLHVKIWSSPATGRTFALVTSPRLGNDSGGVVAFDITDPSVPTRVADLVTYTTFAEGIQVVGDYAYVGGAFSNKFVRVSLHGLDANPPLLTADSTVAHPHYNNMVSQYDAAHGILYAASWCAPWEDDCEDGGGLLAFNVEGCLAEISQPAAAHISPELRHANRVALDGEVAYLPLQGSGKPGIGIVDISLPLDAELPARRVSMQAEAGPMYSLASYGDHVYAFGAHTSTMFVMQAVDPAMTAMVSLDNGYTYGFSGDRFFKYMGPQSPAMPWTPVANYRVKPIARSWGLSTDSPFNYGFDAMEVLSNNVLYAFRGDQWLRYSDGGTPGVVDAGYPKSICPSWGSLPTAFCSGFDSIVYVPANNRVYVTKGSQYIRYDNGGFGNQWSGPWSIAGNWGNLPAEYLTGFDAMTVVGDKLYVFKGSTFVRYANQGVGNQIEGTFPLSHWGALVRDLN